MGFKSLKMFLVVFIFGILLFGCIGNNQTTPPKQNNDSSSSNADNNSFSNGLGTNGNATVNVSNDANSNNGTGFGDKTWSELISVGSAVECDVKYKDTSLMPGFQQAKMFIKAKQFKEVITTLDDGKSKTMTVISNDDGFLYVKYSDSADIVSLTQGKIVCDGVKYVMNVINDSNPSADSGYDTSSPIDTSTFEDANKIELNCKPGLFGNEIFQVSGKYCTMNEIMSALTGGGDICDQITDPDSKAQCEQAFGG